MIRMSEATRTHTPSKQLISISNEARTDQQTNVSLRFREIMQKNLGHKIHLL